VGDAASLTDTRLHSLHTAIYPTRVACISAPCLSHNAPLRLAPSCSQRSTYDSRGDRCLVCCTQSACSAWAAEDVWQP